MTAAAAAGLALVPASAQAQQPRPQAGGGSPKPGSVATFRCCVDTCKNCASPQIAYKCVPLVSGCGSGYCTNCQASQGTCYYRYTC